MTIITIVSTSFTGTGTAVGTAVETTNGLQLGQSEPQLGPGIIVNIHSYYDYLHHDYQY